jgi:hypothetical protein
MFSAGYDVLCSPLRDACSSDELSPREGLNAAIYLFPFSSPLSLTAIMSQLTEHWLVEVVVEVAGIGDVLRSHSLGRIVHPPHSLAVAPCLSNSNRVLSVET